jgi:hypothetical protein
MSNTILDYVVRRACERFDHNGNTFTTATFQTALSIISDSQPMVTPQVAELLLMSIPGVERGDGRCHWRLKP